MPAHQTGISLVGRQILGNGYHSPPGERHDSELHGQAQLDSSPGQYPSFTAESLWQTPQASTLIVTWPASGCGTLRSTSSTNWLADLLSSQFVHSSSLTVDDQGQTLDSEGMPQGNSAWFFPA
jgi:hypothetical protein